MAAQTFDVEMTPDQRQTLIQLLDEVPLVGGRKEGRLLDRVAEALEDTKADASTARLTLENVKHLLDVIDRASTGQRMPDGSRAPGILKGLGFRNLRTVIDRLELAAKGETGEGVAGVEAN